MPSKAAGCHAKVAGDPLGDPTVGHLSGNRVVETARLSPLERKGEQADDVVDVDVADVFVEEQLQVGKRAVQRGGARIHTFVTERPVEAAVTLREEHVTVSRQAVDRPATDADFQSKDITLTETNEEAVVGKTSRVVEEVVVGKTATDRTETVHDTVRRTDVEVDEIDNTRTSR